MPLNIANPLWLFTVYLTFTCCLNSTKNNVKHENIALKRTFGKCCVFPFHFPILKLKNLVVRENKCENKIYFGHEINLFGYRLVLSNVQVLTIGNSIFIILCALYYLKSHKIEEPCNSNLRN